MEPSGNANAILWRSLRRPLANGRVDGLLTLRVQTVLQCAPRARTQGRALAKLSAKRFQRRRGHRPGGGKVSDHHGTFPAKAEQWQSTWQSASKDVPVTGVAGERIMLRVCLSQVRASPSAEKGLAILGNLSRTCPVVGASLEALSLMRSIPLPWVRARGAHCKTACAQFTGKANASPLARSLRGGGVLGQRASCPLRQRRDRHRWRTGASRASGRAGARPSR